MSEGSIPRPRLRVVPAPPVSPPSARTSGARTKTRVLAALRRRIEAIERPALGRGGAAALGFGVAAIDAVLPEGGLRPAGLHEFLGAGGATALVAALAARRLSRDGRGPVLWCLDGASFYPPGPYPPGLAAFGLGAERLILVRARQRREVLWAMEEALAAGRVALVVGEVARLDSTAGRRLQLAAEAGATPALLLRRPDAAATLGALTRWRVASVPSGPAAHASGLGAPRLALELLRARGGAPGAWLIEWNHATCSFSLVAVLVERAVEAAPARARA